MSQPARSLLAVLCVGALSFFPGCGDGTADSDSGVSGDDAGGTSDSGRPIDAGPGPSSCASGCLISDICYPNGVANPANPCQICDVATSATAFSDDDGASCDDGVFCTEGDTCGGGTCGGSARDCGDGIACNGDETCDEVSSACVAGTPTCTGGQLCDAIGDACVSECPGCAIDGVCYGEGQRNPASPCELCESATSASSWTANDGASCDDGLFCTTGDVCTGTTCGGSARVCADSVACNGDETCDETADSCAAGTTTCTGGTLCDQSSDACVATCSGCVIGGVCYAPMTTNPTNTCQICTPTASASAWTANTGATCDDGLYCNMGETCSAAGTCTGGSARACGDGVACNGTETCSESADTCVPGASTCGAGQVCNTTSDSCDVSCGSGLTVCSGMCVNTAIDPNHCMTCSGVCASATNAVGVCVASSCRVACDAGYADCDAAPGCEAHPADDANNCGFCGNTCASGRACVSGVCQACGPVLDQSLTDMSGDVSSWSIGGAYYGQSFTVGRTGTLTQIRFFTTTVASANLEIYSGGISGVTPAGPLLQAQPITTVSGWNTVTLTTPIAVTVGQQYTFRPYNGSGWAAPARNDNPYAAGQALFSATRDLFFETLVTVCGP